MSTHPRVGSLLRPEGPDPASASGQSMVEYGVILLLMVLVVFGAMAALGVAVREELWAVAAAAMP